MSKLRNWLWWKSKREEEQKQQQQGGKSVRTTSGSKSVIATIGDEENEGISPALLKKDRDKAAKQALRRRVRGGAAAAAVQGRPPAAENQTGGDANIGSLPLGQLYVQICFTSLLIHRRWTLDAAEADAPNEADDLNISSLGFEIEFDEHYGLVPPEETVLIRAYSDDTDDRMLDELKPRFIVMFEPCMEFVRRVEVFYFISCAPSLSMECIGVQIVQPRTGCTSLSSCLCQFMRRTQISCGNKTRKGKF